LLLVFALAGMAFKKFPSGHPARGAAVWSLVFIILEAMIGAGLVLFGLVADNSSVARAVVIAAHLFNTLGLLGFLILAIICWKETAPFRSWRALFKHVKPNRYALVGLFAFVVMSGAIVALGNT